MLMLQAKVAELEAPGPARVANLCEMLRADKTCYGTLVQSPSPFWCAWGGPFLSKEVDFIFIDTEHTPIRSTVMTYPPCAISTKARAFLVS